VNEIFKYSSVWDNYFNIIIILIKLWSIGSINTDHNLINMYLITTVKFGARKVYIYESLFATWADGENNKQKLNKWECQPRQKSIMSKQTKHSIDSQSWLPLYLSNWDNACLIQKYITSTKGRFQRICKSTVYSVFNALDEHKTWYWPN